MKLKPYLPALICALVLGATSPMVTAVTTAGKIENATTAEVKQALDESVKITEEALEALKSGADENKVSDLINDARQQIKRVEINRLDVIRTRSADNLKKARQSLSKGDKAQAEEFLSNGLKGFKEMQSSF